MIKGIGQFKGIERFKGISQFEGIAPFNGINTIFDNTNSNGRRISIIKKYGGKYMQIPYINKYIREIAEKNQCHTFMELTGGGGRTILNLPKFRVGDNMYDFSRKIYNEYDLGLCNMFRCVKDETKVRKLRDLLVELGRNEEIYEYAIMTKDDPNIDELISAAFTYIAAMQSWSGTCKKGAFVKGKNKEQRIKLEKDYFRRVDRLIIDQKALRDIEIINGDYKILLDKHGHDEKVLKYIDPPYHPITRNKDVLDVYDFEWSDQMHKELVSKLVNSRSWILSGYDPLIYGCKDYLPLEEAGAKKVSIGVFRNGTNTSKTSKFSKEEYLWIKE